MNFCSDLSIQTDTDEDNRSCDDLQNDSHAEYNALFHRHSSGRNDGKSQYVDLDKSAAVNKLQ
jgi:hypothetical protein